MIYTAAGTSAVQNVRVSEKWIVWYEFSARSSAVDTRLYAMQRGGGAAIQLDDARAHGLFALPADMTLHGDDVYWTAPEVVSGVWKGRLMHRRLPDGPSTTIATAPDGAVIAWPTASQLGVAFELLFEKGPPFTRISHDTPLPTLPPAPISEPALGEDFLVVKLSERFQKGNIGMTMAEGTYELGPGEHPEANGRTAVWFASEPTDNEIHVAFSDRPTCTLTVTANQGRMDVLEFLPSLAEGRLIWVYRDATQPLGQQDTIRIAPVTSSLCQP